MSDLDPTDRAVDGAVEESEVGREELLKRAIVALAEEEGIDVPDAEEVATIESRLDDLDAEVDRKVEDLRERFVDLYQGLDGKAPADHTHEETAERVKSIDADLDALSDRLDEVHADVATEAAAREGVEEAIDDVDDRLARVESTVDGLDELEARVDSLDVDDLDDLDDKLSRVASAVVRIRRRLEAAERDRADREQLDALTTAANRHGVRKADCTDCEGTVQLGLLTAPECPHCGREFADLEPNSGFLGTSRLVVGDRPALDGAVDGSRDGTDGARTSGSDGSGGVSARDDTDRRGGS